MASNNPIEFVENLAGDGINVFLRYTRLRAGFFSSFGTSSTYQDRVNNPWHDAGLTYAAPIIGLLIGAVLAAASAVVAGCAAVVGFGALISTPCAKDTGNQLLLAGMGIGIFFAASLFTFACLAVATLVIPVQVVNSVTRTAATLYEKVSDRISECSHSPSKV